MEGVKIDQKCEKAKVSTFLGSARRSERTPGEEKKRWGPRTQAGNLELAIIDGAVEIVFAFGTPCSPVGRRRMTESASNALRLVKPWSFEPSKGKGEGGLGGGGSNVESCSGGFNRKGLFGPCFFVLFRVLLLFLFAFFFYIDF